MNIYMDLNAPEDEVVAAIASQLAQVNGLARFFMKWTAANGIRSLEDVEEHMLRAEAELRAALSGMVYRPIVEVVEEPIGE